MPLGKETGNYKSKVNENDLYAQVLLSWVKRMSYFLLMKNKQKIKCVAMSHYYFAMS